MFELSYKITESDMKAVNKSLMWRYFIPYLVVSLLGIAAGIVATVLQLRTEIFVLGIVLIVLGSILLGCTVLLAIAPKNFAASALIPSEEVTRTLKIDDGGLTVVTEGSSDIEIRFSEITKLKNKKSYLLAYLGSEMVLLIKDAVTSGGSLEDVYSFLDSKISMQKQSGVGETATETPQKPDTPTESASEESAETPRGSDAEAPEPQDTDTEREAPEADKSAGDEEL